MISRFGVKNVKILRTIDSAELLNLHCLDPIFNKEIKIYEHDAISDKYGSGIEIVCPAHDFEGAIMAGKYNIPTYGILDKNGLISGSALNLYNGTSIISDAGNQIVAQNLKKTGKILWETKGENRFSVEKMSGNRVILLTIPAWFMKIPKLAKSRVLRDSVFGQYIPPLQIQDYEEFKKEASEELKKKHENKKKDPTEIKSHIKSYYLPFVKYINEMNDLCISEENHWSIPIPCFQNKETKELLMNSEIISYIAQKFKEYGSDYWYSANISELLPPEFLHLAPKLEKIYESFDAQFLSALACFYNAKQNSVKQADFCVECHDKHEPWISKAALFSAILNKNLPFRMLKTHGRIVDNNGELPKNTIYPDNSIDGSIKIEGDRKYGLGADVLRAWAAINDTASDIIIEEKHFDNVNRMIKKIRQIFEKSFIILSTIQNKENKPELNIIDEYILSKLDDLITEIREKYEKHNFSEIMPMTSEFMNKFFQNYLSFYTLETASQTHFVLSRVINCMAQILHPITPYLSAELLESLNNKDFTVEMLGWPELLYKNAQIRSFDLLESLFLLRTEVKNSVKEIEETKKSLNKNNIEIYLIYKENIDDIEEIGINLPQFFKVKNVSIGNSTAIEKDIHIKSIKLSKSECKIPLVAHIRKYIKPKEKMVSQLKI